MKYPFRGIENNITGGFIMFRIISDKKCINKIRELIKIADKNVKEGGYDQYKQFENVYNYMMFAHNCGLLKRKTLDKLWRELQLATNL